jgi:photosystem II stability/assembly factor-like uncharacterized protein
MSDPNLEPKIRSYYRRLEPDDSTRLALAARAKLDEARQPRPGRSLWATLRLAATLVGAVIIVAVLLQGRFGADQGTVPGGGTGSPGPTFNLPAALDAQVDQAGLMRTGGIWAVQGSYLLTSTDNGETWSAGSFPALNFETGSLAGPSDVFVLDPNHAWSISRHIVSGSSPDAGPTPAGELFAVDRTADGGKSWQSTPVSGDYGCDTATISFVDASSGFIMCAVPASSPSGPITPETTTPGRGTVLRTDDGGASWSVAGNAAGLGSQFTASDATTLWSAPDSYSSVLTGPALHASRDAGLTWSLVDLPELASVPSGSGVQVEAGPVFWDSSDGAIAVGVYRRGTSDQPAVWFYRTSDAGRTWTLAKTPSMGPPMGNFPPGALVGREWAAIGTSTNGFFGLRESSDFGATWTEVPGFGMPQNSAFMWVDFTDAGHGVAEILAGPGIYALMLSSDGGRTWHAADFGGARAKVPANAATDPASARQVVVDFEERAYKASPPMAWNMLSSYSQRAFGSESTFESSLSALAKRTNYAYQIGAPTQDAGIRNRLSLTPGVWDDITAFGDWSRAYVLVVSYPGSAEPPETFVAAPLTVTGEWRIWVVTMP